MRIGVIGLGTMGSRIAAKLHDSGLEVVGYDIAKGTLAAAARSGIAISSSAQELATTAQAIVLSLPLPADVIVTSEAIAETADGGALVVDLSTIDPASARNAESILSRVNVGYVDSPVLGRPTACGNWTLVAGGAAEACQRAESLLVGAIARRLVHAGPVGSGCVIKLLNNLMFGAINSITAEALFVCAKSGIDPAFFAATLSESGAASVSGLFKELAPRVAARDFQPTFSVALLNKDNGLAIQLAEEVGVPLIVGGAIHLLNQMAMATGLGPEDTGAAIKVYERLCAASGGSEPAGAPA